MAPSLDGVVLTLTTWQVIDDSGAGPVSSVVRDLNASLLASLTEAQDVMSKIVLESKSLMHPTLLVNTSQGV